MKKKNSACSHCSVFMQLHSEYDEVFTLLQANTVLITAFLDKYFQWKITVAFKCLRIWCSHWKRSVFKMQRIRKYAYLLAFSKTSVLLRFHSNAVWTELYTLMMLLVWKALECFLNSSFSFFLHPAFLASKYSVPLCPIYMKHKGNLALF